MLQVTDKSVRDFPVRARMRKDGLIEVQFWLSNLYLLDNVMLGTPAEWQKRRLFDQISFLREKLGVYDPEVEPDVSCRMERQVDAAIRAAEKLIIKLEGEAK